MNWINIITEHWVEAVMAGTIGITAVLLGLLLSGKALRRQTVSQYLFGFLLICYLFLLGIATGILNPNDISVDIFRMRSVNLIPFQRFTLEQVLLNIILFLPLGFMLPLVFRPLKKPAWGKVLIACFGVSLLVELMQLFHKWRAFDVNDLMTNVLGGLIGYGVYLLLTRLFKR